MTREQRQALRVSLEAQGFVRASFTDDLSGTGQYIEIWRLHDTEVNIWWGARV